MTPENLLAPTTILPAAAALFNPSAWAAGFGGFAIWGFPIYLAVLNACILVDRL